MTPTQFIKLWWPTVTNVTDSTGIFPEVMMAQGILESGYGASDVAVNANNYFGIEADSSWTGPVYNKYRKYSTANDSFKDYVSFLQGNPRYNAVLFAPDIATQVDDITAAGYSENPTYASTLNKIIPSIASSLSSSVPVPSVPASQSPQPDSSDSSGTGLSDGWLIGGIAALIAGVVWYKNR
jgi:flagellum-specific peptidoglycan hydrolase FlgJ